jgi:hypothetical protein
MKAYRKLVVNAESAASVNAGGKNYEPLNAAFPESALVVDFKTALLKQVMLT